MDALITWITQIIIFLLFATIIDLLIPANTMRKYIQFVVGLIMILIFLKPVFYILDIDIQDAIETSFQSEVVESDISDQLDKSINIKKGEIESTQDAYILEEMVVQLKNIAQEPLEKEFGINIVTIDFKFTKPQDYTYENLEELIVYINERDDEKGVIDDVDDVKINTNDFDSSDQKEEHEQTKEIKNKLREVWELDDISITVLEEGGTS